MREKPSDKERLNYMIQSIDNILEFAMVERLKEATKFYDFHNYKS